MAYLIRSISRARINSMVVVPLTQYHLTRHILKPVQARWSSDMAPVSSKRAMPRK